MPAAVKAITHASRWRDLWRGRWTPADAERFRASGVWTRDDMWALASRHAAEIPENVAFDDGEVAVTWGQLHERASSVAAALLARGMGQGDATVIRAGTSIDHAVLVFALNAIGIAVYEIATDYSARDVRQAIERAGASALVTDTEPEAAATSALRPPALVIALPPLEFSRAIRFAELRSLSSESFPGSGADAVNILIGTSGTTGTPKIVMHSASTSLATGRSLNCRTRLSRGDVIMAAAPLSGGVGYMNGICAGLVAGATTVLPRSLDTENLLHLVQTRRVNVVATLPTVVGRMASSPRLEFTDVSSLRCVQAGGAYVTRESARAFESRLGCPLAIVYGSMDIGVTTMTDPMADPEDRRHTTVGTPLPGVELMLRAPDGGPVAPGETGEVAVRGPSSSLGYFNDPAATAEVIGADGWGRMGDLGTQDLDGYVRIVGRIKDIIIRGGRNISANAVEEAVSQCPGVKDVAAVGYPDSDLGERCAVFIIQHPGSEELTLPRLQDFLASRDVAKYMWPERLVVVDEFDLSPLGKVLKRKLRDRLVAGTD